MLIRITAPHFTAGIDTATGQCAPIIKYMRGWYPAQIYDYCARKGWSLLTVAELNAEDLELRQSYLDPESFLDDPTKGD